MRGWSRCRCAEHLERRLERCPGNHRRADSMRLRLAGGIAARQVRAGHFYLRQTHFDRFGCSCAGRKSYAPDTCRDRRGQRNCRAPRLRQSFSWYCEPKSHGAVASPIAIYELQKAKSARTGDREGDGGSARPEHSCHGARDRFDKANNNPRPLLPIENRRRGSGVGHHYTTYVGQRASYWRPHSAAARPCIW